jgi:hypothetical protein
MDFPRSHSLRIQRESDGSSTVDLQALDVQSQSYVHVESDSQEISIISTPSKCVAFDKSVVDERLQQLWDLSQEFGREQNPFDVFLVFTNCITTNFVQRTCKTESIIGRTCS